MNTENNQLRKDSDRRMQHALLGFLAQEKTPTVGDICRTAKVNRSTFYRHYLDIFDLMEKTERTIQTELVAAMKQGGLKPDLETLTPEALIPMVEFIGSYRSFYRSYLKTHLDVSVEEGMQTVWDKYLKPMFRAHGVTDETHMLYYYQNFKAGVLSMLKLWIDRDCAESPQEVAEMITKTLNRS